MKHKFLICFLLSVLICLGSVALADEIAFIKKDGFITKITEKSGEVYELPGIIDADKIEKSQCADEILSYEILKGDKLLITVNFVDIMSEANAQLFGESAMQNGYYSTEFTLSEEDNTEVFLTGLTPENLEKVQSALLDAVIENSNFELEDVDFIDAEKLDDWGDGDDLLCWAATSSNMLHYTGWGKKANPAFNTTDDIFENFKENFTDQGGDAYYAFEWFFDGFYTKQGVDRWAQVKNYGSSGGYLKQYSPAQFIKRYYSKDIVNHFYKGYKLLHEGYGVYINVGWLNEEIGATEDAHAITLWGYICDKDYSERNHEFFKAFIVSDSDDYQIYGDDRRNSPNILHVLNVSHYNKFGYNTWKTDGYGDCGIFQGYTALPPYSDDILFETDKKATQNSLTTPDLLPQDISFIQSGNTFSLNDYSKFYSGSSITLKTEIGNDSAVECPYGANLKLEVINKKTGKQVYSKSYDITATIPVFSPFYLDWQHKLPTLEKGEYSAVLTVNEGKKITESYYYNNSKTWNFEIIDKATAPTKITASIEKFSKGKAKVGFTISGVDKAKLSENAEGYIYKSIYKDGAWGDYVIVATSGGAVPTSCYIDADGNRIKFKYVLFNDKNAQPLEVISPEYKLSYEKLSLALGEGHIYYSPYVDYGVNSFGEYGYAFDVKNESTLSSGKINYSVSVITKKDNKVLMKKEGEQLAFGESNSYEFASWEENLSPGEHEVYVVLESDICEPVEFYLGRLFYYEKGGLIVNCEGESEAFDSKTSLREAISYATKNPGAGEVVIPKGYKITLDYTLDIYGNYTLDGNGCEITCLSGGFFPLSYNNVTLKNLKLNGGGRTVWGINAYSATLNLENVNFINMKSSNLGVALNVSGGSKIYAKNCTFSGNVATGNYITYSNGSTVQFVNCIFENNSTYGDQVYFKSSNVVVAHCIFGKLNGLNAFAENTHFKACNNGGVSVYGSIIAGNVSGYVSLYGSYIGGKSSFYVSCDKKSYIGEIDTIMLTDEDGNPVYKNGEYILSDKIYDGVMLKNQDGKLYYSYDGTDWKNSYKDTVFATEDFCADINGVEHSFLIGAYAKAAEKGAVISADDENMVLFMPSEGNGYLGVSSYKGDRSLDTFTYEPVSLLPGKNTISIPERVSGKTYTYMIWNEDMEPMTEAYIK